MRTMCMGLFSHPGMHAHQQHALLYHDGALGAAAGVSVHDRDSLSMRVMRVHMARVWVRGCHIDAKGPCSGLHPASSLAVSMNSAHDDIERTSPTRLRQLRNTAKHGVQWLLDLPMDGTTQIRAAYPPPSTPSTVSATLYEVDIVRQGIVMPWDSHDGQRAQLHCIYIHTDHLPR